ncbi:MAG: fibrillarin-like rRNA/tRNA 2'-O-methyltransferase, partial [Promethearchaeota archaeon]
AQPNQTEILIKNVRRYLTPRKGQFIYEIKARSIDTIADPKDIFQQEKEKLERAGLQITDSVNIGSFQKDHQVLFGRYLGESATE